MYSQYCVHSKLLLESLKSQTNTAVGNAGLEPPQEWEQSVTPSSDPTQIYLATVPLTSYARYLAFAPSFDRLQQNPEDSIISQLIVTITDSEKIAASLAGGGGGRMLSTSGTGNWGRGSEAREKLTHESRTSGVLILRK